MKQKIKIGSRIQIKDNTVLNGRKGTVTKIKQERISFDLDEPYGELGENNYSRDISQIELIPLFPFQVNTFGHPEVKKMLIKLYEKSGRGHNFDSKDEYSNHCYLQIWGNSNENYRAWNGLTNDNVAFEPDKCPVIPLEEAIQRLAPTPKTKTVNLNGSYSAEIIEGQDFITVGCRKFEISKLKELMTAIEEVNN